VSDLRLAITGGTGFVGSTLIRMAVEQGHHVQALTRKRQPATQGIEWIEGALDQPSSLARLVDGCDAIIHVAGVVNAPDKAGFVMGNVAGTQAMIDAASRGGVRRFVQVSSLAAREPDLSNYGWSKAQAEGTVAASELDWVMVRPPAIYGPGDRDQLDLFKAARMYLMPMPPRGHLSLLEVSDLCRLLIVLAAPNGPKEQIFEADDGVSGGWSYLEYALAIGEALGKRVLPVSVPGGIVRMGARIDRLMRGEKARLTLDRASYFCHPDWVIDPAKRPPSTLWEPQIETRAGLAITARAYREAGWL
jgi:nucleoside-diphosphate-sugar epimerase